MAATYPKMSTADGTWALKPWPARPLCHSRWRGRRRGARPLCHPRWRGRLLILRSRLRGRHFDAPAAFTDVRSGGSRDAGQRPHAGANSAASAAASAICFCSHLSKASVLRLE